MNVSHDTILQKMIDELQAARRKEVGEKTIIQHVKNVRLLADLVIEDDEAHARQAIPDTQRPITDLNTTRQQDPPTAHTLKPAEEPADSIFDF